MDEQNVNKSQVTKRIIQYFEDPKDSQALSEIKKISDMAKKSSKNIRNSLNDFNNDKDLENDTERKKPNFVRREFQFPTQTYIPKNDNVSLYDEIKLKLKHNKEKNKEQKSSDKFNLDDPGKSEDRVGGNEEKEKVKEKKPFNGKIFHFSSEKKKFDEKNNSENKNKNINLNKYNYNRIDDNKNNRNSPSYLRRNKKLNTDLQKERNKLSGHSKENDHNYNNRIINDFRLIYDPYYEKLEDFKKKNDVEIENVGGKDRIIINVNKTKEKDNKKLKHYKSEYIWAKTINRIAEKRIFSDKNVKTNKPYNNIVNYNNNFQKNLDDDKDKDKDKENKEKIKVDEKYDDQNDDNKENDNNKDENTPIKKRYDNTIMTQKNEDDDKYKNKPINNVENPNKNFNKNYRYKREFKNYNTINTPKKEEIIIEKKTVITVEDENKDNKEKVKVNENIQKEDMQKDNIEKDNIEKDNKEKQSDKKPIKEEINNDIKPTYKGFRRRYFYLNKDNKDNKEREPIPGKIQVKNITKEEEEPKYKKKPKYEDIDKPKVIYTKKIITAEERRPQQRTIVEKKIEKEEKPINNPYNQYRKKNIRINLMSNFNEEKDTINEQRIKNNPYSNYMKSKKNKIDNDIYRRKRVDSDLIDDLERIENYNITTYLKNDLLQIYDNISQELGDFKNDIFYTNINSFEIKMGEFDKNEIPYLKKTTKIEDLCRGRVTTEDMYKKYSNNARKFGREKKYYK